MLPYDIISYIMQIFYSKHVLPLIETIDTNRWMRKCSQKRKSICMERGSIQIGYSFNDAWSVVYLPERIQCSVCTENVLCNDCFLMYSKCTN